MSLTFFPMSIGFMSHVNFKKWLCRLIDFKGQGPLVWVSEHFQHICQFCKDTCCGPVSGFECSDSLGKHAFRIGVS